VMMVMMVVVVVMIITLHSDVQLCMHIAINQLDYNFYIMLCSESFMVILYRHILSNRLILNILFKYT
jgi:hypothetical protein